MLQSMGLQRIQHDLELNSNKINNELWEVKMTVRVLHMKRYGAYL